MLSHSVSLSRLLLGVCLADELHHSGVGQCGDVTQLVQLVLRNLAQDPLHDLSRTCLWEESRYYLHGGEGRGGEGISGVSWGWVYTWEVALKGVCGKCALPACMCHDVPRTYRCACVRPERCL